MSPDTVPFSSLSEQALHVVLIVSPDLLIISADMNGCGVPRTGTPALQGKPLFALFPPSPEGSTSWQSRLYLSYTQVIEAAAPISLILSQRQNSAEELIASTLLAAPDIAILSDLAAALRFEGVWHICHAPLLDDNAALVAIVTYATLFRYPAHTFGPGTDNEVQQHRPVSLMQMPVPTTGVSASDLAATEKMPGVMSNGMHSDGAKNGVEHAPPITSIVSGLRILLVEDGEDLRIVTIEQLKLLGHHVTGVADAETALRYLDSASFDLLFTDLTLPKMTGAELARLVLQKALPIQVVITSGYGRALANAQNLDALFLPKPYRLNDLEDIIAQVRQRRL